MRTERTPLPPGLDPVEAGRFGLWLLSKRQHHRALRRRAIPRPRVRAWTLARAVMTHLAPWHVWEYPGERRLLSGLLGIAESYANNLLKPSFVLPAQHALALAEYLEGHASAASALAHELREHAASRSGISRFRRRKQPLTILPQQSIKLPVQSQRRPATPQRR